MAETQANNVLMEIDGDLVLRRASPADADRLADFNARIHGENPDDARGVAAWVRDLLTLPHPTFQPEDFLIVEKKGSGEVVSSLNLISQTWAYEGIPFKVGRPELVGTDPEYRGRGLVRKQFELIHQWSQERGELVQAITGIPYFYRQFGYEMTLELSGGRMGYETHLPKLKEGEEEPYRVRAAGEADIPFLLRMAEREQRIWMVNPLRDEACWRDEIGGKSAENVNRKQVCIIETPQGQPVGYLVHSPFIWGTMQALTNYMLDEGVSYLALNPSVIRYLWTIGEKYAAERERKIDSYGFWLGTDHPAYHAARGWLVRESAPYAYYMRVPDLPAFLRLIAPALEQRLSASPCAGHSGEIKISFYRGGLRLVLEQGRLAVIEPWQPQIQKDEGDAAFPNLTFLHLVFGFRSIDDLRRVYIDCSVRDHARPLLEALFPTRPSSVWPVS